MNQEGTAMNDLDLNMDKAMALRGIAVALGMRLS